MTSGKSLSRKKKREEKEAAMIDCLKLEKRWLKIRGEMKVELSRAAESKPQTVKLQRCTIALLSSYTLGLPHTVH